METTQTTPNRQTWFYLVFATIAALPLLGLSYWHFTQQDRTTALPSNPVEFGLVPQFNERGLMVSERGQVNLSENGFSVTSAIPEVSGEEVKAWPLALGKLLQNLPDGELVVLIEYDVRLVDEALQTGSADIGLSISNVGMYSNGEITVGKDWSAHSVMATIPATAPRDTDVHFMVKTKHETGSANGTPPTIEFKNLRYSLL
ncbi:MAG: hypothetical protein AAFN43_08390 [Pseudomonadota bacterium]